MQTEKAQIPARDGAGITTFIAHPDTAPIGVAVINHGFGEHIGSYGELLERLTAGGYIAVIFDHRGHGEMNEPDRAKWKKLIGIIPGYQCFLDDVEVVTQEMRRRFPNLPLALYGHSMGGNIAVNYLLRAKDSPFCCAILESPWLGLFKPVHPVQASMARILGKLSPKLAIYNKLPHTDITGDTESVEELDDDPLYHNRISFRMFAGINEGCAYALANASRLNIPTYLAYAENECIVCNKAIERFGADSGNCVSLHRYASRHAVHSDTVREQYYADIMNYLNAHMGHNE